jgi:hypothetical protein
MVPQRAEPTAAAVIEAISEQVPASAHQHFVRKLEAHGTRPVLRAPDAAGISPAAFRKRVAALTGLSEAHAVEAAQVVCATLAEVLDPDTRVWLVARLPEELGEWLSGRQTPSFAHQATHGKRRDSTLAEGRPGSAHPLSEAHPKRAHADSIAHSDNPHGDTKLASSPGPTQAREHTTLAEGDPRPARPLSSGRQ